MQPAQECLTPEQVVAARLQAQELAEQETLMASKRRNRMLEVQPSCGPSGSLLPSFLISYAAATMPRDWPPQTLYMHVSSMPAAAALATPLALVLLRLRQLISKLLV